MMDRFMIAVEYFIISDSLVTTIRITRMSARRKTTSSPPFLLRDSRGSETRARVRITPREKRQHTRRKELRKISPLRVAFSRVG